MRLRAPDRGAMTRGRLADVVAWDADHEGAFAWSYGLAALPGLARRRASAGLGPGGRARRQRGVSWPGSPWRGQSRSSPIPPRACRPLRPARIAWLSSRCGCSPAALVADDGDPGATAAIEEAAARGERLTTARPAPDRFAAAYRAAAEAGARRGRVGTPVRAAVGNGQLSRASGGEVADPGPGDRRAHHRNGPWTGRAHGCRGCRRRPGSGRDGRGASALRGAGRLVLRARRSRTRCWPAAGCSRRAAAAPAPSPGSSRRPGWSRARSADHVPARTRRSTGAHQGRGRGRLPTWPREFAGQSGRRSGRRPRRGRAHVRPLTGQRTLADRLAAVIPHVRRVYLVEAGTAIRAHTGPGMLGSHGGAAPGRRLTVACCRHAQSTAITARRQAPSRAAEGQASGSQAAGGRATEGRLRKVGTVTVIVGEEELLVERAVAAVVAQAREGRRTAIQGPDVHDVRARRPGSRRAGHADRPFTVRRRLRRDRQGRAGRELGGGGRAGPARSGDAGGGMLVVTHAGGAKGKALLAALIKAGARRVDCPSIRRFGERMDFLRAELGQSGPQGRRRRPAGADRSRRNGSAGPGCGL